MALLVVSFVLLLVVPVLMSHLIAGMSRSAAGMQWMSMDEELSLEPEVAYKTAQVLVARDRDVALLSGVTEGRSYDADADARCRRPNCEPPGLDCVCGFYAFKSYDEAARMLGRTIGYYGVRPTALLTVELEGEVLEYERGFRAQHQRVLSVSFTLGCDLCERFQVQRDAVCLAASTTFVPRRFTGLGSPTVAIPEGYMPVRPVCAEHIPDDSAARILDPRQLAGMLGTEVRWLTPGQADKAA